MCKLLEGIIRDRFIWVTWLISELVSKDQHCLVKKACVTNLLEILEFILSMLVVGECIDVIFLKFF